MSTNWDAMQTPVDPKLKRSVAVSGVKPRYLAMGSWHADKSKGGTFRPRKLRSRR